VDRHSRTGEGGKWSAHVSSSFAGRIFDFALVSCRTSPSRVFLQVYDISTWTDHPGGRVIYSAAGSDATDSFKAFHSPYAEGMLKKEFDGRAVGWLEGQEAKKALTPFEEDYRKLYVEIARRGLMQARFVISPFPFRSFGGPLPSLPPWSPDKRLPAPPPPVPSPSPPRACSGLYYTWKILFNLSILGFAAYLTIAYESLAIKMVSALLVALFWQQCGWLAHDFAHHQVFRNRKLNDCVTLFVGNFCQAFSLEWWKNKHNTHHAIPNLHESTPEAHDGDPDIDTLPFLAWSKRLVAKTLPGGTESGSFARFCVRYQAFLYFPILFFARITWVLQSLSYAFQLELGFFGSETTKQKEVAAALEGKAAVPVASLRYPIAERVLLVLHWTWYFILAFGPWNGPLVGLLYFFVSQTFSGLLLAVAFGVGHNGMQVFDSDKKPGFAELQVRTTRNVEDKWLNGWFMGGLHYQVEHHLFPMVPRHNLSQIAPDVIALCRKHNVPYRCTGLIEGNKEVLSYLQDVTDALAHFPAI
jgi:fatty acid desaturase